MRARVLCVCVSVCVVCLCVPGCCFCLCVCVYVCVCVCVCFLTQLSTLLLMSCPVWCGTDGAVSVTAPGPLRPTHQWQWLEDGGVWTPYDYDQNHEIEAAFNARKDKVRIIGDRGGEHSRSKFGFEYDVILTPASDGCYRQVRRLHAGGGADSAGPLKYWWCCCTWSRWFLWLLLSW